MYRLTTTLLLGALMLAGLPLAVTPAAARETLARVDASVRARFRESGRVSRIAPSTRTLIVDDGTLEMSPWVHVYTASGGPASVADLHRGMPIAFNWNWPDPKRKPVVTEILILSEPRT